MPAWTPKFKKDQDYNGKTTLQKWWVMVSELFESLADGLAGWTRSHAEGAVLDHPDQSVTTAKLADGAVIAAKLGNGAVTTEKLQPGAVESAKLANGAVTSGKLAPGSIVNEKLAAGAVTAVKLAAGSVGAIAILDGSVSTEKLKDAAITRQKLHPAFSSPLADAAERVAGIDAAANSCYYGTNHEKVIGFFPLPGAAEVYVYDPTTGKDGLLADVIRNLFNTLKPAPITVGELVGAGLTVQQIKDKRATVRDVSINGKVILGG